MKNKTGRKILAVATVLAIVAGSIAVVSAEGILEKGITYSAVAIHDDPSSNHDIVNAKLSEYTSAIYNRAYKENAVDKKSTPGQTVTTLSSSVTILDHMMCKASDQNGNPIDRTSKFYTTDRYAVLWYKLFVPKNLGYNKTVRWYDPDGNLEEEGTSENQASYLSYESRNFHYLYITGNPPANKTGNWHVTFYLNGVKKFTEYFTISNLSTPTHSALTIYVPDDYALIQDAVDAASPGDTIIVSEGTYEENIEVCKRLITIQSEKGPESTVVQAEYLDLPVFEVTAAYVNISGFTVKGANEDAGIYLDYPAGYCTISNNICSNNEDGILLFIASKSNSVSNNVCSDNEDCGISLAMSNSNNISNNVCSDNEDYGISLAMSNSNNISNNICSDNEDYGIRVDRSDNNNVSNNKCPSNNCSIYLKYSANNSVSGNVCSYSSACGIFLVESTNNVLSNNHCTYNIAGIGLMNSTNNIISNNHWTYNYEGIGLRNTSDNNSIFRNNCSHSEAGIFPAYSNNNNIYLNNIMNNDVNAGSFKSSNTWSSTSKINYTYNGKTYTNYLGNYWDDYSRSDNDNDGIGDSSYRIDGNRDRYPLMEPWEKYF